MTLLNKILGREPIFAGIPHAIKGKGHYGEYLTEYALSNNNVPGKLKLYSNTLVPRDGGVSEAEIDVLMLHEKGIYVFESKNYSGWIFGSENQREWTQTLASGQKKRFYNPVKQNKRHIEALANALDLQEDAFVSFIVFSERCELKKVPPNTPRLHICRRHHLTRDVNKDLKARQIQFDHDRFEALVEILDSLNENSTRERMCVHVEEVKAIIENTRCPACGSALVERKREKDGTPFLGCSRFPKCRYTNRIN